MKELKMSLPDDRPISALAIVEEVSKCPYGYSLVSRTYDQDLDGIIILY
jgi:ESCRT-I complex subunit MVB12